jgi:hypothetical protein
MSFQTAPVRGVEVHYGTRTTNGRFGGAYGYKGGVATAVYSYDVTDLPTAGADNLVLDIPAYAKIQKVTTEILEAVTQDGDRTGFDISTAIGDFTGTDVSMGLARGTAGVDVSAVTTPTSVGSAGAELALTLTATGGSGGSLTGGKLRTIVEYMPEGA